MTRRLHLIAALLAVYLFGIATPYLARFPLALLGQSMRGEEEYSRKPSPDGVLDAVVIQDNPGAFSSYRYYLYLVPRGSKVKALSPDPPIVNTSEGDALVVNWEKPHFLTVTTGNSHVKFFGNLWYSKRVPDYYVELTLVPTGRRYLQENGKIRGQQ
jgi:hypothetical protein